MPQRALRNSIIRGFAHTVVSLLKLITIKSSVMKKHHLLLLATLLGSSLAFGEQDSSWKIKSVYASLNAGSTINEFSLNVGFKNRWMAFVSINNGEIESVNKPIDYRGGSSSFFFMTSNDDAPKDEFKTYDLGIRRIITAPSDKAWLSLGAGISLISYQERMFRKVEYRASSNDVFDYLFGSFFQDLGISSNPSNYADAGLKPARTGVGATISLQANINLFEFMGINAGVSTHLNNIRNSYGANIGLNIGFMRKMKMQKAN
jgi:hypothetical protein